LPDDELRHSLKVMEDLIRVRSVALHGAARLGEADIVHANHISETPIFKRMAVSPLVDSQAEPPMSLQNTAIAIHLTVIRVGMAASDRVLEGGVARGRGRLIPSTSSPSIVDVILDHALGITEDSSDRVTCPHERVPQLEGSEEHGIELQEASSEGGAPPLGLRYLDSIPITASHALYHCLGRAARIEGLDIVLHDGIEAFAHLLGKVRSSVAIADVEEGIAADLAHAMAVFVAAASSLHTGLATFEGLDGDGKVEVHLALFPVREGLHLALSVRSCQASAWGGLCLSL
jgi:hypothetical protein